MSEQSLSPHAIATPIEIMAEEIAEGGSVAIGLSAIAYWRICDALTIVQAALLLLGCDPASEYSHVEGWKIHERPTGYEAVKQAILGAVRGGKVAAEIVQQIESDMNGNEYPLAGTIDLERTTVAVDSLRQWLADRGVTSRFFAQVPRSGPDYLNPEHPRYAPKLAAAVRAWMAVDDPQGKSPKSALSKWLRENARDYGLSDDEGKPNEQGIEECAKVANWQPGGGAPRTPGS